MDDTVMEGDSPASSSMANSPSTGKSPEKQKRKKKTLRACHHCQKAHLTCDERRPCLRCVKRGLADTCADGARKKAKYLRDYEEALLAQSSSRAGIGTEDVSPSTTNNHNEHSFGLIDANPVAPFDSTSLSAGLDVNPAHAPQVGPVGPSPTTTAEQGPNLVPFFSSTDFGSEAAGFEYAILSSMLTGGGFPSSSDSPGSSNYLAGGQSSTADAFGPVPTSTADPSPFPEFPMSASTGPTDPSPLFTASNPPNGPSPFPSSVAPPAIPPHSPSHQSRPPHHPPQSPSQMRTKVKRAEKAEGSDEVYRKVTRPYRYTDSYHFLIRHLKERSVPLSLQSFLHPLRSEATKVREERHPPRRPRARNLPPQPDRAPDAADRGGRDLCREVFPEDHHRPPPSPSLFAVGTIADEGM